MRVRSAVLAVGAAAVLLSALSAWTFAEEPSEALTRGKVAMDAGKAQEAAEAFTAVTKSSEASKQQHWEALIRLAVARRVLGDLKGSADAFEQAWHDYGDDREARRFLLESVGSAVPGTERWNEVWKDVRLEIDRTVPTEPAVRVLWPGVPAHFERSTRTPLVNLDFKDGDYNDILRLVADLSGFNIVVNPGTRGTVTYHTQNTPWDTMLHDILAPYGYVARIEGNVVRIGRPEDIAPQAGQNASQPVERFTGKPIDIEYHDVALADVLREIAAHGGARAEIPEGVSGRVTLKLDHVPWDQAFDLVVRLNGLAWTREGDVFRLQLRGHAR
jgi:hypothetical protein